MKFTGKIVRKKKNQERIIFNPHRIMIIDPNPDDGKHQKRAGIYAHFCFDWYDRLIDENDVEFSSCTCGVPNLKT